MKNTSPRFNFSDGTAIFLQAFFMLVVLSYPASRSSAALPDLITDRPQLARTILIEKKTFGTGDCALVEGCVGGEGERRLLRFAVGFINIGPGHLFLGRPENHPEFFVYSPCHEHYHLKDAATYVLRRLDGTKVVARRKQAFCFEDDLKYSSSAGPPKFTCEYQGLSQGWKDVYYRNLECQWLDITGVPKGNYTLTVIVNQSRIFRESNYSNNSVTVPVYIPPDR